jgi:hypothetical protein
VTERRSSNLPWSVYRPSGISVLSKTSPLNSNGTPWFFAIA